MEINKTALLLIDLQNEGGCEVMGMENIIEKAKVAIDACRKRGVPIIYTRHINRADAVGLINKEPVDQAGKPIYYRSDTDAIEIVDRIKPESHDIVVDKYRYSGFYESGLDVILRGLGVKHLIVAGVLTDVCVLATVYDAYNRDYQVTILKDACGTTTEGAHMSAMLMMANWIYDLVVIEANELSKKLNGEEHRSWAATAPDELQFSPDNIKEVFARL